MSFVPPLKGCAELYLTALQYLKKGAIVHTSPGRTGALEGE